MKKRLEEEEQETRKKLRRAAWSPA
uniref:Uncharacterized protein n=1 Tax=Anguilla anguilla TaxID=7936 RepID=A0A0E9U1F4_ANGAN